MIGGQRHLPISRSVPWEVSHPICAGAWQNNHNGPWKKDPHSAQWLNIHLGWDSHTLQQTEPSTRPSPSPLQTTEQKTWNPFILAYISKLTRGESTLQGCPVCPGNSLSSIGLKTQLWRGIIPSGSKEGGGHRLPTHCTLNCCQLIQWQLEMKHLPKPSSPSLICHWRTWSQF